MNKSSKIVNQNSNKMIIAKQFSSEREMAKWLSNDAGLKKLKKEYDPKLYTAELNYFNRQIEVRMRK